MQDNLNLFHISTTNYYGKFPSNFWTYFPTFLSVQEVLARDRNKETWNIWIQGIISVIINIFMFSEHIPFSTSPFSSWRTTSPVTELQAICSQHELLASLKKEYTTATLSNISGLKRTSWSRKTQINLKTFLYSSLGFFCCL